MFSTDFRRIYYNLHGKETNFISTPEATVDNSSMITYNTDSHTQYGYLARYPAANHSGGWLPIYDWETGVYLGKIPQVIISFSLNFF